MANVLLCLYTKENIVHYEGRLLGLATSEMYAKFLKNKSLINRLYTSGTVRCGDIAKRESVEGLRLLMTVKSKNDVSTMDRTIFFSEPLDMITDEKSGKISVVGKNETHYEVMEIEK